MKILDNKDTQRSNVTLILINCTCGFPFAFLETAIRHYPLPCVPRLRTCGIGVKYIVLSFVFSLPYARYLFSCCV